MTRIRSRSLPAQDGELTRRDNNSDGSMACAADRKTGAAAGAGWNPSTRGSTKRVAEKCPGLLRSAANSVPRWTPAGASPAPTRDGGDLRRVKKSCPGVVTRALDLL